MIFFGKPQAIHVFDGISGNGSTAFWDFICYSKMSINTLVAPIRWKARDAYLIGRIADEIVIVAWALAFATLPVHRTGTGTVWIPV